MLAFDFMNFFGRVDAGESSGTALGCTERVKGGAVPNEHGTWLYGRGGWCDGLQVDPWRTDITKQVTQLPPFSFHLLINLVCPQHTSTLS